MSKRHVAAPATAYPVAWSEPALHPRYLGLFDTLLGGHDIDAAPLLSRHGLPLRVVGNDEQLLPYAPIHHAICEAISLTGRPWLGLEFGAIAQPFNHGQVGFATSASETLLGALQTLTRFAELRTRSVQFALQQQGQDTLLQLREPFELGQARVFVLEACLVIVDRLMQSLAGTPLLGTHYQLPWTRPAWAGLYPQYLTAPVQFGAEVLSMRFPGALLARSCLGADPESFQLAQRECERKLEHGRPGRDFASRVRKQLLASTGALPDAGEMARRLNLSPRGLFRHLREAGVSYQGLVDELRCEQACWFLRNTREPIETIAEQLGFADGSNFSRTFKRWTGTTPRVHRSGRSEPPATSR